MTNKLLVPTVTFLNYYIILTILTIIIFIIIDKLVINYILKRSNLPRKYYVNTKYTFRILIITILLAIIAYSLGHYIIFTILTMVTIIIFATI